MAIQSSFPDRNQSEEFSLSFQSDELSELPYQPKLVHQISEELKITFLRQCGAKGDLDQGTLEFLAGTKPFSSQIDVAHLVSKGMALEQIDGKHIPVFWFETANEIPIERRSKLLEAIRQGKYLDHHFAHPSDISELHIEYFDDRGQNRRVLLVATPGEQPFVIKYTHNEISPIAQQQGILKRVIRGFQSSESLAPVCAPGLSCQVQGTDIFSEEYISGATRAEMIPFYMERNSVSRSVVANALARVEGVGLARIWRATASIDSGIILKDCTERNVRFQRNRYGEVQARYFDMENAQMTPSTYALSGYLDHSEINFYRNPHFVLGWVEGLGAESVHDYFRSYTAPDLLIRDLALLASSLESFALLEGAHSTIEKDSYTREAGELTKLIGQCIVNNKRLNAWSDNYHEKLGVRLASVARQGPPLESLRSFHDLASKAFSGSQVTFKELRESLVCILNGFIEIGIQPSRSHDLLAE